MKLKVRCVDVEAGGKTVAIINSDDARELGLHALDRIIISHGSKSVTALVDLSHKYVRSGIISIYNDVAKNLCVKNNYIVDVFPRAFLESKNYIRKKIDGKELDEKEISTIINDINKRNLNDLEIASLITALHINGKTLHEDICFTKAMIKTSTTQLKFPGKVVDKHSTGGVPGDKTSMLLVPIIAATGLTIPKTSSRAITDPAGTADRMEVLTPVTLGSKELEHVVRKTGGCLVWGGSLNLAPVDDMIIQIEKPLSMDPLIIPSILAKKKVVGSKIVVIDIPVGPETKFRNKAEAKKIAKTFISVGKAVGMRVDYIITDGHQPLGYAMGPALEAREALQAITNPAGAPKDLIKKVLDVAGLLLKTSGKDPNIAKKILFNGMAEKKFRDIISAQGGEKNIVPEDIPIERKTYQAEIKSSKQGKIMHINNKTLINIAKIAGAPRDVYSGLLLNKKTGDIVKKGDILFKIYTEHNNKLIFAKSMAARGCGYVIR